MKILPILPVPMTPTVFPWRSNPVSPLSEKLKSRVRLYALWGAAHGGEQQRDGVLRHGIGRVGGHMDDVDLAEGGPHVHVVVAGGAQGDQLDAVFVQPLDHGGVDRVVHEHAHRVAAPGQLHRVLVQLGLQEAELHAMLAAILFEGRLVIFLRVIEGDLDHLCHSP